MKFAFVNIITEHVVNQFEFVNKISDYLEIELMNRNYGRGLTKAIFGIGCSGPLSDAWRNIETGTVSQLKYTKSKKMLELTVSLNYNEVKIASNDELIEILKRGISKSQEKVKPLKIKDFNLDAFYKDLEVLLDDREWLKHPEKYEKPFFVFKPEREQEEIPKELKMALDDFWDLIQESIAESQGNVENQIVFMIDRLSAKSEEEIIGFELTLRELIKRGYDYNVVGLLKVIDGTVTDDSLLCFRCRLILYGKEAFYAVLRNPNALVRMYSADSQSELLLNVADHAFINKFGENTDRERPGDVANKYIDYNTNNYPMMGIPWKEKDFIKRYATLLKLYS